jgi:hypothetical protein
MSAEVVTHPALGVEDRRRWLALAVPRGTADRASTGPRRTCAGGRRRSRLRVVSFCSGGGEHGMTAFRVELETTDWTR